MNVLSHHPKGHRETCLLSASRCLRSAEDCKISTNVSTSSAARLSLRLCLCAVMFFAHSVNDLNWISSKLYLTYQMVKAEAEWIRLGIWEVSVFVKQTSILDSEIIKPKVYINIHLYMQKPTCCHPRTSNRGATLSREGCECHLPLNSDLHPTWEFSLCILCRVEKLLVSYRRGRVYIESV